MRTRQSDTRHHCSWYCQGDIHARIIVSWSHDAADVRATTLRLCPRIRAQYEVLDVRPIAEIDLDAEWTAHNRAHTTTFAPDWQLTQKPTRPPDAAFLLRYRYREEAP